MLHLLVSIWAVVRPKSWLRAFSLFPAMAACRLVHDLGFGSLGQTLGWVSHLLGVAFVLSVLCCLVLTLARAYVVIRTSWHESNGHLVITKHETLGHHVFSHGPKAKDYGPDYHFHPHRFD